MSQCPDVSFSGSESCLISSPFVFSLSPTCIHMHVPFLFTVSDSHSCSCPQGSARSGWKRFTRPRTSPPVNPRSAQTASPTPPQTSEACWSSAVTKAECWCPWRGAKSGSAKQNRYFQHHRDILSTGWQLPVWKGEIIITTYLKQMRKSCSWKRWRDSCMCNAQGKYMCEHTGGYLETSDALHLVVEETDAHGKLFIKCSNGYSQGRSIKAHHIQIERSLPIPELRPFAKFSALTLPSTLWCLRVCIAPMQTNL